MITNKKKEALILAARTVNNKTSRKRRQNIVSGLQKYIYCQKLKNQDAIAAIYYLQLGEKSYGLWG